MHVPICKNNRFHILNSWLSAVLRITFAHTTVILSVSLLFLNLNCYLLCYLLQKCAQTTNKRNSLFVVAIYHSFVCQIITITWYMQGFLMNQYMFYILLCFFVYY